MAEPNPLINHAVEVARANVAHWPEQALEALTGRSRDSLGAGAFTK